MSIFDTIAQSKVFEQGNWFKPGIFDVTIKDISHFQSGQGKGPMVAARFIVDAATPTETTTDKDLPPGSQASCVFVMNSQVGPSNLKSLLVAAGKALAVKVGRNPDDVTPEKLTPADYEKFCAPNSPLLGLKLRATCFTKTSKKGSPYVAISWGLV